jgi:hypothetical protein
LMYFKFKSVASMPRSPFHSSGAMSLPSHKRKLNNKLEKLNNPKF